MLSNRIESEACFLGADGWDRWSWTAESILHLGSLFESRQYLKFRLKKLLLELAFCLRLCLMPLRIRTWGWVYVTSALGVPSSGVYNWKYYWVWIGKHQSSLQSFTLWRPELKFQRYNKLGYSTWKGKASTETQRTPIPYCYTIAVSCGTLGDTRSKIFSPIFCLEQFKCG